MTTTSALPEDWVPVERRFLGLDRRTIWAPLGLLVLVAFYGIALPAINEAVSYDRQVQAGDVIDVGGGVTFVPAVGWGIVKGSLTREPSRSGAEATTAVVVNGGVTFAVTQAPFTGSPGRLLTVIDRTTSLLRDNDGFNTKGPRARITTAQGEEGVMQKYTSTASEGVLAAFSEGGVGVKITASGPPDAVQQQVRDVASMIDSLHFDTGSTR